MKRKHLIFIIIFIILFIPFTVKAKVEEEIIKENTNSFILKIRISEDEQEELLDIKSYLFQGIENYMTIKPGDEVKIKLQIINNSSYNYTYKENSFKIQTSSLSNEEKNNLGKTNSIGFDNKNILGNQTPFRSYNEAIKKLIKNSKSKKLTTNNLDKLLKDKNYQGIGQLHKYYLDYYNKRYHYKKKSLEEFPKKIKKKIFSSKITSIKETNKDVVACFYNYYYQKLLSFSIDNKKGEKYGIARLMENKVEEEKIREKLKEVLSQGKVEISNMLLSLDKNSPKKQIYYLNIDMSLQLEKVI